MYCPNCGKTNSAEQKFCRACGFNLEKTVESLSEQFPAADLDRSLQERQRRLNRWIAIIAGSTISILVGGVLWGIIYEIIIVKGEVLTGALFAAFIIGLVLSGLLMLYRESAVKSPGKQRATQPMESRQGDSAKLFPETQRETILSVTERTTELIVEKRMGKE